MKRICCYITPLLGLLLLATSTAAAQSRKEHKVVYGSHYRYEIEPIGVGKNGGTVFKVWGFGKEIEEARTNAKEVAVASCLFKGLASGAGSTPKPPIIGETDAEITHANYLEKFFESGGKYLQYITVVDFNELNAENQLKVKNGYRVAIYVQFNYDDLRKQMAVDRIASKLDAGF